MGTNYILVSTLLRSWCLFKTSQFIRYCPGYEELCRLNEILAVLLRVLAGSREESG